MNSKLAVKKSSTTNAKNSQILLALFLLTALFLTSCQTPNEMDVWPIVYYDNNPEKQESHLDLLMSFYSQHEDAEKTSYSFRPFFVGEFPKNKNELRMMFFWPFIYYHKQPNQAKIWIVPFYYSLDKRWPELGERDFDWFFLPFFTFGGTDTKEGPYLYMGVWGNIKGKLGYDEITGKPFPFYVTARDGEYFSEGYMWPFFRFGEGGGKRFRFYAFMYSDYQKEGKFRRRSYFWPFVHYNLEQLDKKHPVTELMVFPFYGQSTSEVSAAYVFLWPFFSYSHHQPNNYTEYNMPWPFFKYQTGGNSEEFRIWPIYWTRQKEAGGTKENDLILMWPFFWHTQGDYPTYHKESLYVLPFYWGHWRKGKEEGAQITQRHKIWPLYEYHHKEDGSVRQRILSPFWFEDYFPEGFEKNWLPFFTLFDYRTGSFGHENVTFLGPLYNYQQDQDSTYHRVLFFSYKNQPKQDLSRFSVLGGLFEYQSDQKETGLRFFYLPHITWGSE